MCWGAALFLTAVMAVGRPGSLRVRASGLACSAEAGTDATAMVAAEGSTPATATSADNGQYVEDMLVMDPRLLRQAVV